ncbi:MAG TPA: hypothetical protein VFA20_17570 [Myxococcaceae bacterium]|nr:hypothetical protein [Myxococcaceae bacterium]
MTAALAAAVLLVVAQQQPRPGGAGYQRAPGGLPSWSAGPRGVSGAAPAAAEHGAPESVVLAGLRAHVFFDEELEPDAVRLLARKSCTAWVRTRTNMVRESVVERLARFGAAFVQLRAPFLEAHGGQLQRWPGVGAWLGPGDLRARGVGGVGGRPWAVSLFGPLRAEDLGTVAWAKVAEVRWTPGPRDLTLEAWARFAQAPGSKVVVWPGGAPAECEAWARARAGAPPAIKVGPMEPAALGKVAAACPLVTRVEVPATADEGALARLLAAWPRMEPEVDVGASSAQARAAARLLDGLEARVSGLSAIP